MKSKKKSQRKWESLHYQSPEKYSYSKKEKEYLSKYRKIAGEYLEDWELIELFKKNNFDDDLITKELNKIILGDDYKWKEIKNGKPVTTRSTDQVRKRQKYYKADKAYMKYEKTEGDNESNNKRKIKGSFHKNLNDFYHYVSKKPKRPFQKCIEVPSDYLPLKNNNNIQENQNIINTDDNINNNDDINNNNNKIIPSKSANNIIKIDNEKNKINELGNNININNDNKNAIKKALPINMNMNNKMEETKNNESDKIISDEEQRKIILIKGEVFKNLKRIKTNTETKFKENKNRQKEIYKQKDSSEKRIQTSSGIDSDYSLSNKDIKNDKALQKKYLKIFFGNMNHYSKKIENNIKRASSKDSETSDDRPETIKRNINNNKRNNIPTSSNIIQKKIRSMNISSSNNKNNMNNNNINKNLRRAYELDQRDQEIRLESKVVNLTINACYDNPYRDQYLKFINEKRKKNPGKIVELIIPQYNNMYMPPFPFQYQYNPYLNQNMFMYQSPIHNQNLNSQNKQNMNNVEPIHNSMNMQQYQPLSNVSMNSQYNSQITPMNNNFFGVNKEILNANYSNKETNSDNQINNNMSDN